MTSIMEQSSEFNLREWGLKARISRENTKSRRFSASNLRSYREDARSFRSNITISSTASSPGNPIREEIDPSTYSFTTALYALQARSVNTWECLSPDGFALNSKWNEAEKYICNPLSGEFPMECLSAKTLSGRSFRHLTSRITMSAPLIYQSHTRLHHTKPSISTNLEEEVHITKQEKKTGRMTRDVGTQSTPPDLSSSSPSPAPTPSIGERSIKHCEAEDSYSPNFSAKEKSDEVEVSEMRKEEDTETNKKCKRKKGKQLCRCIQGGCLSWRILCMRRRQREKHKLPAGKNKNYLLCHNNGCNQE